MLCFEQITVLEIKKFEKLKVFETKCNRHVSQEKSYYLRVRIISSDHAEGDQHVFYELVSILRDNRKTLYII